MKKSNYWSSSFWTKTHIISHNFNAINVKTHQKIGSVSSVRLLAVPDTSKAIWPSIILTQNTQLPWAFLMLPSGVMNVTAISMHNSWDQPEFSLVIPNSQSINLSSKKNQTKNKRKSINFLKSWKKWSLNKKSRLRQTLLSNSNHLHIRS